MDRFSDAINTIKTNERTGRAECVVDSTKLIKAVMEVMKKESYINGFVEYKERHARMLRISLANKINSIGVVKPRYAIGKNDIQRYESRYIPSRDFGILIISTPKGVMTNREAKVNGVGGRLLAYVY
ncbi:MAG: 30S ribosomal protein S8 [Candidatus Marsarchaeota archaeon]|jgi:small subunit ribosomal protein S8|nr:30S ribosomal protein S8 [Candidatus Marsarchaeota archaeon]MCL5112068.1 30S ribosomal protein S8 [Candidatus Marsarchaeota archaeon]